MNDSFFAAYKNKNHIKKATYFKKETHKNPLIVQVCFGCFII